MIKVVELLIVWLFMAILLVASSREDRFVEKSRYIFVCACIVVSSVYCAIRTLGLDLYNYEQEYLKYSSFSWNEFTRLFSIENILGERFGPVIYMFYSISKSFGLPFAVPLFFMSLIPQILIYRFIRSTNRPIFYYTLFMLYNIPNFDKIRQTVSMGIYFTSLISSNIVIIIALVILSIGAHSSSVVGIISFPLSSRKAVLSRLNFFILCIIGAISLKVVLELTIHVLEITGQYRMSTMIKYYINHDTLYYNFVNTEHRILYYIFSTFPIIIALIMRIHLNREELFQNSIENRLYKSFEIGIVISIACIISLDGIALATRMFQLFGIGSFYVYGSIIQNRNDRTDKTIVYGGALLYNIVTSVYYYGAFSGWRF